ncbi:hypothetical protein BCR35DRAFT_352510 [Leucosporidium creatinivorum]|uniref:chitin deacetylase n=1 Tax=Leucosporidium creatinivorum TaxID=106004 RepID=A0A1Y2FBD5_9BASI|nr:hypothetical protein BCR35DRAFT_352510 [Leucosporidium creatinivorum]
MKLIKVAVLFSSVLSCTASPLFKRQSSSSYPDPGAVGPTPKDSSIAAYNTAKAAGKLVDVSPATALDGGAPSYPSDVDTSSAGICSWTMTGCFAPDDLYSAPDGRWGVSFDDGPVPSSPTLYTFLESMNQSATHFMIGGNIVNNPDIFKQAIASGGHIAIHTWSHPYMSTMTDLQVLGELGWTAQVIYDLSGFVPAFWRPPYGDVDNRVRAIAKEVFGLTTTIWNQDTDDWCLSESGGTSCTGEGPADDSALDAEMLAFAAMAKSPGLMVLEHELTSLSIGGFTRNYASLLSSGWDIMSIPDAWGFSWYLNARSNAGPVDASITVGGGSPSSINSSSPTKASQPLTTVTITPSPLTTVTLRTSAGLESAAVGQPLADAAATSGVEGRTARVCWGVLALLVATVAWLVQGA